MTQRGEEQTRQIHDGLACPTCQYSLRGLPGDDVTCPECGGGINIPELVASKWTGPRICAPLYNMLIIPLVWSFLGIFGGAIAFTMFCSGIKAPAVAMLSVILGGWMVALAFVSRRFGSAEGALLAILLHACFPAYLFGITGGVALLIRIPIDILDGRLPLLIYDVPAMALCIGAIVVGERIERFVTRRCIRRYLQRRTGGASHAA